MILGIESSCDESALALFDPQQGIVGEWVSSQIKLHQAYGGVVPDLASREHLKNFFPLLEQVLNRSVNVDRIAVTYGPGLAGCLAMGMALAKSLALAWRVPLAGVNHLRGHAFSPFIPLHRTAAETFTEKLTHFLPHLGLLVSGGNTLLFEMDAERHFNIIAQTVDDAAGEALDKGAKLLGLPYPGGPLIERQALQGDPLAFAFPRAFPAAHNLKFSFSGLKTSLRYRLEKMDDAEVQSALPNLCASYQQAVIDPLILKTRQVLEQKSFRSLGLSGGVANNQRLRDAFADLANQTKQPLFIAERPHTGDNAAMVAFAAWADPTISFQEDAWELSFHPALVL